MYYVNYPGFRDVNLRSGQYVLVLPGWYPTSQDPFSGDFNQRHVKAAGLYRPQVVLYIVKDKSGQLTEIETTFLQVSENVVEVIVIYPARKNKVLDNFYSNYQFVRLLYGFTRMIIGRWGRPSLIHSYIAIRGGLGGWLMGRKWNLPFLLTENWTIYDRKDPGCIGKRNPIFRFVVRIVFKNLSWFLPVTDDLQRQVKKLFGNIPHTVVPNVVDTRLFYYTPGTRTNVPFKFIHVSTMSYQKNPEGLLRAYARFNELFSGSCLSMVGPYPDRVFEYSRELGLDARTVHFTGSISYEQVGAQLRASDALVLFSRFENLPCVIIEALCCGLPVISTAVGGIPEAIASENGILVESENEVELTAAFINLYTGYANYNKTKIATAAAKRYNYEAVGKEIAAIYDKLS